MATYSCAYTRAVSTPASPSFPTTDPAKPAFWDDRFAAGFTPWQRASIPPELSSYLTQLQPGKVLIPGCGSANELQAFALAGWDPTAVDFSPVAVAQARSRLGALATHVQQADFFDANALMGRYQVVYECAFMCALPPGLRTAWATRIDALLPEVGTELTGLFFIGETGRGPPFAITSDELAALLRAFECVEVAVSQEQPLPFGGNERWMRWRRVR
jgi:SAM-dependent methyltransferase